uniref:Uncharacterized protein n=1 Tax=Oryza rufipogon TaxID=4529 RepID=A0A0E0QGE4_ORYRU
MVEVLVEEEAPPMCKKEAMAAIVEGLPGRDECDLETLVVVVVLVVVEPVVAAVAARAAAGYESGQGVVPKDRLGASRERTCCGGALVATGAAVRARCCHQLPRLLRRRAPLAAARARPLRRPASPPSHCLRPPPAPPCLAAAAASSPPPPRY